MLTRTFQRGFFRLSTNSLRSLFKRNYSNENKKDNNNNKKNKNTNNNNTLLPGGGLEKLQGGMREENYFRQHDQDLIGKLREQGGDKLKCEMCLGDWAEFDKVLDAKVDKTALRETCSLNKHKNCMEEAFFMNEQTDSLKICQDKLKLDNNKNNNKKSDTSLKISPVSEKVRQNSEKNNDEPNPPIE